MSTTLLMSWFGYSENRPSLSQCAAGEPKPALDSELTENLLWNRYAILHESRRLRSRRCNQCSETAQFFLGLFYFS
jgi:hypothetical protein